MADATTWDARGEAEEKEWQPLDAKMHVCCQLL
jgi:hypothetical protein